MHKLSLFALLLTCLVMPVLGFAQDGGTLTFDETVTGEISADQPEVRYTFEGRAGDVITINMNAEPGTLDSFLELIGPDGTSLLTADDYAGSLNSQIGPYTLPETGTYTVVATRCCGGGGTGGSVGAYELALRQADVASLTIGETVTATLSDEQPNLFFRVESDAKAILTLEAKTVEGDRPILVEVRNEEGQVVNSGWQANNTPVLIDPLILSEGGSYVINVSLQQNTDPAAAPTSGNVRVSLTLNEVEAQPIEIGQTVEGTLDDDNPSDHYTFSGASEDLLRLEGSQTPDSEAFEAVVYGPSGFSINGVNTGFVEPVGSFTLDPLQLFDDGDYLLVVRRIDADGEGEMGTTHYTLTLSESQTPTLEAGAAVEGKVGGDTYERVYHYEGTAGQTIRITLRSDSDSYAPALNVQGPNTQTTERVAAPDGSPFVFSANGSTPGMVIYEVTLPEDGTYLFRINNGAYSPEGPAEGDFNLLVEVVE